MKPQLFTEIDDVNFRGAVNNLEDLYLIFTDGGEKDWFAYVRSASKFAYWSVKRLEWVLDSGDVDSDKITCRYSIDATTWTDTYSEDMVYIQFSYDGGTTWGDAIYYKGSAGENGDPGSVGNGISKIERTNGNGAAGTTDTITITYTNGGTTQFLVYNGANGKDGNDGDPGNPGSNGRGIVSIERTDGNGAAGTTDTYTITYTDNSTTTYQVVNGSNGQDGDASGAFLGVQVLDGTTVAFVPTVLKPHAQLTLSGNTTITFSNIPAGLTGNIVINSPASTSYTLNLAGNYLFKIFPSIYISSNQVKVSGNGKTDVLSYYYDGTYLVINGTVGYNDYNGEAA